MAELIEHDVLIVGGGGAGLRAAIALAEIDPNLSVAVVSKVYPMRSHTVAAEGGAAGVIKENDSFEDHIYDTISGGDWLCDQEAVELFVHEAPKELMQLEHWGCPWNREPDGSIAVRPFGGMKIERTWFAADKVGFHMLHTLFQTSLKYDPIVRYDEWFVTTLLVDDGRVQGVVALELMSGKIQAITAKAVILCTGGCGKVFPFTTNANIKNGDETTANIEKWDPSTWPKEAKGVGTNEAPRGALGHWIKIKDGKIENYQAVVPTTWNGSPRDSEGNIGAFEASLLNTPMERPDEPVEILRTLHSFDPCLACSTHVMSEDGQELTKVKIR